MTYNGIPRDESMTTVHCVILIVYYAITSSIILAHCT